MMLTLLSDKSGQIPLLEIPGLEGVKKHYQHFSGETAAGGKISMQLLTRPDFQAALFNIRLTREERIVFSGIPGPYTLVFVFGYSITLYLSRSLKKDIHDRGGHLFHSADGCFEMGFQKDRNYLVISVHYSTGFVRQNLEETAQAIRIRWELSSPVFYYSRARITDREMLELLSALMLTNPANLKKGLMPEEIAGVIFKDFLLETRRPFQPAHLGAKHFETFYKERDDLTTQSLKILPVSKLLQAAGIRNIPQFRKKMNQLYHLNIREFITEIRMTCAMNLLKDPTLSIKEIAGQSGFKSAFYFSRVFTNYFGMAPKFFRNSLEFI